MAAPTPLFDSMALELAKVTTNPWSSPFDDNLALDPEDEIDTAAKVREQEDSVLSRKMRRAAALGDAQMVAELLEEGAEVQHKDNAGRMAIHYASGAGSHEVVEVLLRWRADPNAKDKVGNKPMDEADYWAVKRQTGDVGDQLRQRCLATLELLALHGGQRSVPSERTDGDFILRRRQQLEKFARKRGERPPWLSERPPPACATASLLALPAALPAAPTQLVPLAAAAAPPPQQAAEAAEEAASGRESDLTTPPPTPPPGRPGGCAWL